MANEQTVSTWMATAPVPLRDPLRENISADVCIVGAGIAGMTTAYLLASEGKAVVVVDDGAIGGGMTGRTTAHLVNVLDDRCDALGKVIQGPANSDLPKVAAEEASAQSNSAKCS